MNRRKIAFIGASYLFTHRVVRDFLSTGIMDNTDLMFYDIDKESLKLEYDLCSRMIKQQRSGMTIAMAKSRASALSGADYVVVSVLVGGMKVAEQEDRICRKYGIRHTVGDTIGPMCVSRCLRMVPLHLDIAKDMEKYCPNAWMLSVTNPMSVLTSSVNQHTKIRCIGICHGTSGRVKSIAKVYNVNPSEVSLNVVGVNHLGFITGIKIKGRKKELVTVAEDITEDGKKGHQDIAGYHDKDILANTFARRYGFIPTNGDHHFIEFFPWFLGAQAFKNGRNIYGIDKSLFSSKARIERKKSLKKIVSDWAYDEKPVPDLDKPSGENVHSIILGLEGVHGDNVHCQRELYLNITNNRAVPNLPENACLELTTYMSAKGPEPLVNESLNPFLHGILSPLVDHNMLIEKAAVDKDLKAFEMALTIDPLVGNFKSIPNLAEELWKVNKLFFKPVK